MNILTRTNFLAWQRTLRALVGTAIVASMLLVACRAPSVKPTPASQPPTSDELAPVAGAVRYDVVSSESSVHILVYRGGAMARLGHNHVVASSDVTGTVWLHSELGRSKFRVTMPVSKLSVDDPAARATEGADFSAEVPQDAREGTRRNLMRPEVLDGDRFPNVVLQSLAIEGTREAPRLKMRIIIKDAQRETICPVQLKLERAQLTAKGQFEIKQSDFGITPFSVALGALQVVDTLNIKFSIVARQQ